MGLVNAKLYRIQYMPVFVLHDDVKDDFKRISVNSPAAVGRIAAALEAAEEDETLLQHLHSKHYRTYGDHDIDVKKWALANRLGYALSRFRFFYLEENGFLYRIIYALDDEYDECHVLAILRRDEIDYDDPDHPINQRIFCAYQGLGL